MATDARKLSPPNRAGVLHHRSTLFLAAMILLSQLPLLISYLVWANRDGHYQYFPLMLAAIGGLLYYRRREIADAQNAPSGYLVGIGWPLIAATTFLGHLLYSGFIGIVAFAASVTLGVYTLFGRGGLFAAAPILSLFALAIPLPLGLDSQIIVEMQLLASSLASVLLDATGLLHVREGVLIKTLSASYLTEEACSGVRSLFSSLAVVSVYGVHCRHALPRVTINLLACVLWVVIGNSIRVAASIWLADHVSPWFAEGPGHDVVSIGNFLFILAMVGCTDQTAAMLLDGWVEWYEEPEFDEALDADDSQDEIAVERIPSLGRLRFVFLGVFAVLSVFGLLAWRAQARPTFDLASLPRLPALGDNDMPEELAGWKKVGYEHIQRSEQDLFARDSYTWTYQLGDQTAVVSVDCPWDQWHNLHICYTALGWESEPEYFLPTPPDQPNPELTFTRLTLRKPAEMKLGLVLFTAVDAKKRDVISKSWRERIRHPQRFLRNFVRGRISPILQGDPEPDVDMPVSTIQVYTQNTEMRSPASQSPVETLFLSGRLKLLGCSRWQP